MVLHWEHRIHSPLCLFLTPPLPFTFFLPFRFEALQLEWQRVVGVSKCGAPIQQERSLTATFVWLSPATALHTSYAIIFYFIFFYAEGFLSSFSPTDQRARVRGRAGVSHNELDGTLTGSATSVSVIKDESIENKCLSMWMVYANEAGEESLFGCCVAAAERLIPHRVKTQRLRAEFEADIVLRVMKYSAGEAAKTGWRQGGGKTAAQRC